MWISSMLAHVVHTFVSPIKVDRRQDQISPVSSSIAKRAKPSLSSPGIRKSPRLQKRPLEIQNEISSSLSSSSKKRKAALEAFEREKKQTQKRKKDVVEEDVANQSRANVEEKKQKVGPNEDHDGGDNDDDEVKVPLTAPTSQEESKARTPLKLAQLSELTSPSQAPKSPKNVETRPMIDNLNDWNADKARLKKRADKLLSAFD